jgi:hypothetical protein
MLNLGGLQMLLGGRAITTSRLVRGRRGGVAADAAQALVAWPASTCDSSSTTTPENARKALALLEGREGLPRRIGQSQLVLGRALMEQGRLDGRAGLLAADAVFQADGVGWAQGGHGWLRNLAGRQETTVRRHVSIGSPQSAQDPF